MLDWFLWRLGVASHLSVASAVLTGRVGPKLQRDRGAVLLGGIVVIFGILIGFLANDVWDRNRRAAGAVRSEAAKPDIPL